jgi:hypothetical protein
MVASGGVAYPAAHEIAHGPIDPRLGQAPLRSLKSTSSGRNEVRKRDARRIMAVTDWRKQRRVWPQLLNLRINCI